MAWIRYGKPLIISYYILVSDLRFTFIIYSRQALYILEQSIINLPFEKKLINYTYTFKSCFLFLILQKIVDSLTPPPA